MHSKIDLYRKYHQNQNNYPGNSLNFHYNNIYNLIKESQSKSALDYGCGKAQGYFKDKIHLKWGIEKMGLYDPAIPQYDKIPDDNFDCVISTDVLEHVPESEIPDTLTEIFSLANKCVYLNIAMYPAVAVLANGENAHCTLKPIDWWREKISETIKENIIVHVVYSFSHNMNNTKYEIYSKA